MSVAARVRAELAKRAPRVEEAAVRAHWRRRNRARALGSAEAPQPASRALADDLRAHGFAVTRFGELIGDGSLWAEAETEARRLYEARGTTAAAAEGGKGAFLLKLASARYDAGHPFVRIALAPAVLEVVNGYLGLRSTLRALELWHTRPTPGAPIETQLWHRDADDVMNVKAFVYFTDVTRAAGPLTYAPSTHPVGRVRGVPEHDRNRRSTDSQMAAVVPPSQWRVLEGAPGTIVLADTCGYHKQLKPESAERVKLVAQYVSGAAYVGQALELSGVDAGSLTVDQHWAALGRPPA